MFVDSHAHLDGKVFAGDRDEVLARARDARVEHLLAVGNGNGPDDVDCGIRLAEQYDWIHATLGIHPHEARLANDAAFCRMEELARHPKIVAWGEIGLDYWYDHSPRDVQRDVFARQVDLAKAAKLPIVIHCRPSRNSNHDAWNDLFDLLREHWAAAGIAGVMHCFTGTIEQAKMSLDMGFVLSFAGNITYPSAQNIRDAAKFAPLDRMLIETDCPYLAPIPNRGKRNEPAYVALTARFIADQRGIGIEEFASATTQNFYRIFGIQPRLSENI